MAHSSEIQDVALAAIAREKTILVRRRRDDPALGEVWELPGGKRESGETSAEAAAREAHEETGLDVGPGPLLFAMCHVYPDRRVALHVHACDVAGDPEAARGRWLTLEELRDRPVPAANGPILDALERWLVGELA